MANKGRKPKKKDGEIIPYKDVPPSRDMPVTIDTVTNPAILQEIKEYAVSGCTMEQIANRLMVNVATLYRWTNRYVELRDVIIEGKTVADDRVEQSLYDMCFGHDEKEVVVEKDGNNVITKQTIRSRHVEPDVRAIQMWLQNRRPDIWKNRQQLELQKSTEAPFAIVYDLNTKAEPSIRRINSPSPD